MTKTILSSWLTKPSVFPPIWLARIYLKFSHAVLLPPCRFKAVFWFFHPSHASLPGMILLLYSQPSFFVQTVWKRPQEKLFGGKKRPRKSLSIPIYNLVPWGVYVFFSIRVYKVPLHALAMSSTVITGFGKWDLRGFITFQSPINSFACRFALLVFMRLLLFLSRTSILEKHH